MYYDIFQRLCNERSVTPAKVARETGISTVTFTHWKQGKYTPKQDKLQKIADYFGVTLEYLMTGEELEYYINPEAAEMAQQIFQKEGLRTLFDAARDASPQDLELAAEMLKRMKGTNPDA